MANIMPPSVVLHCLLKCAWIISERRVVTHRCTSKYGKYESMETIERERDRERQRGRKSLEIYENI